MRRNLSVLLCVVLAIVNMYVPVYATELSETEQFSSEEVLQNENSFAESMDKTITDDIQSEDSGDVDEIKESIVLHDVYEGDGFKVYFDVTDSWSGGYNALIKIENISDQNIDNWMMTFEYAGEISNIWNANISSRDGNRYTVKNAGWNQDIEPGQNVEFGISSQEDYQGVPGEYKIIGTIQENDENEYDVIYKVESDWGSGFTASVAITSHSAETIEDWILEFDYDRNITNIWNAEIVEHEGHHYVLKNKGYNANITKNQTINIGFNGNGGSRDDLLGRVVLKSSKNNDGCINGLDTDGDGLSDDDELYITLTDPEKRDTDDDGILDADEDFDCDDLINIKEINFYTSPYSQDTDYDELSDAEELNIYHTNPTLWDTDGDSISDYYECFFGLNPCLKEETDEDGTINMTYSLDSDSPYIKMSIDISVYPEQVNSFRAVGIPESDIIINDKIPGYLGCGSAYDFELEGEFKSAKLSFNIDDSILSVNDFTPAIYYYDEEDQLLEKLDDVTWVENTVSVELEHFSRYLLLNETLFQKVWEYEINYDSEGLRNTSSDIAILIDSSESMSWYDPYGDRKKVAIDFINKLTENDRIAVIDFDSLARLYCGFTNDKNKLISAVNRVDSYGGTDFTNAISMALDKFNGIDSTNRQKAIVLLTDGSGAYDSYYTRKAKEMEVVIYTIGLGNSVNSTLLKNMSEGTGGQYFPASDASELYSIYESILELTEMNKDSDKDGISDYHEKHIESGEIRLGTGAKISGLDYMSSDSDGDLLEDGKELVVSHKGFKVYVKMYSNPTLVDTDSDGIDDKVDQYPLLHSSFENLDNYKKTGDWGSKWFEIHASDLERVDDDLADYYDTVVIHHTARCQYEDIKDLEYHESVINHNHFNGIPYHFVIDGNGVIYEGRPINYKGSHVAKNNTSKIGIVLMGNFQSDADGIAMRLKDALPTKPTNKQIDSLQKLLVVLDTQYGIDCVGGHRDFTVEDNSTECPGNALYEVLETYNLIKLH